MNKRISRARYPASQGPSLEKNLKRGLKQVRIKKEGHAEVIYR
jgi:hypothetical protein